MKKVKITLIATLSLASIIFIANSLSSRAIIIRIAKRYLGTPYHFGGISPATGFDCSGFTYYVYKTSGITIPRNSVMQYLKGKQVTTKDVKPADLIFFKIDGKTISHVGIYLGDNKFIHSPQKGKNIRIDSLKLKYWQKRFAAFKSYIPK